MNISVIVPLLVPIVTALAGIAGITIQDWRAHRTRVGRRKLALEDARLQVSFATEWWKARKLISDSAEALNEATGSALTWLEQASAQVAESQALHNVKRPPVTLGRRLLLFYRLNGQAAMILKVLFYVFSIFFLISCAVTASDARTGYVGGDLALDAFLALLTLGLRLAAVSSQSPE